MSVLSIGDIFFEEIEKHLAEREEADSSMLDFFSKRVKIKDLHSQIIPLVPNKPQLHHQALKDKYIKEGRDARFLLLKYRRGGFTTWEQAISYYFINTTPNVSCATIADTASNTKTIFRMVSLMLHLDTYLKYKPEDSKVCIELPSINSIFHIGTAGSRSFSRGDNLRRVHGSEVSRWPGSVDDIADIVAGIVEAARYGEVTLETTAWGSQGWFWETFNEAMKGENNWIPLFYPWFIDEENVLPLSSENKAEFLDTIQPEEKDVIEKFNLSIPQMLFRRAKKKEHKKLFQQEFPETWEQAFVVRGSTFFDLDTLDLISSRTSGPIKQSESLTVWEEPKENEEYCAGADAADENTGNSDFSTCGILRKSTGKQVAILRGKWRPEVFARKAIELCKLYNNAIFACEINNHGHSVMNTVVNTLCYKFVYWHLKTLDKDKFGKLKKEKRPGWVTTALTRPILLDELNEALESGNMIVNDTIFLAEARNFIDNIGKYEARTGQHDDSIFAWGIAWQARKQVKKVLSII